MEEYGYDIIQTLITDIIPDTNVKKVGGPRVHFAV